MANNFHKPGHGNPTLSTAVGTFWSTDPYQVGNGEFQSVKLGIYGERLTLNFTKGNTCGKYSPYVAIKQTHFIF